MDSHNPFTSHQISHYSSCQDGNNNGDEQSHSNAGNSLSVCQGDNDRLGVRSGTRVVGGLATAGLGALSTIRVGSLAAVRLGSLAAVRLGRCVTALSTWVTTVGSWGRLASLRGNVTIASALSTWAASGNGLVSSRTLRLAGVAGLVTVGRLWVTGGVAFRRAGVAGLATVGRLKMTSRVTLVPIVALATRVAVG